MSVASPSSPPVLVAFVCPACAGENGASLLALARAGGMSCAVCQRWLKSSDVARAIHAPRAPRDATSPPVRAVAPARPATAPPLGTTVSPPRTDIRSAPVARAPAGERRPWTRR